MLICENETFFVEAVSPINIALVKYWGKAHEKLIIPANSSLSLTVDKRDLCSRTRVTLVPSQDEKLAVNIKLNGKQEQVTSRILNVILTIKDICKTQSDEKVQF